MVLRVKITNHLKHWEKINRRQKILIITICDIRITSTKYFFIFIHGIFINIYNFSKAKEAHKLWAGGVKWGQLRKLLFLTYWTKRTICFAKYCNKPVKRLWLCQHCQYWYFDLSKVKYLLFSNSNKIFKNFFFKNLFSLMARPSPPPS